MVCDMCGRSVHTDDTNSCPVCGREDLCEACCNRHVGKCEVKNRELFETYDKDKLNFS